MKKYIRGKLNSVRKRAKSKGWKYDLDEKWLRKKLQRGKCEMTGVRFDTKTSYDRSPYSPTIDRINPSKGYTKSNCRLVVWLLNSAKSDNSYDELYDWAKIFVGRLKKFGSKTY